MIFDEIEIFNKNFDFWPKWDFSKQKNFDAHFDI